MRHAQATSLLRPPLRSGRFSRSPSFQDDSATLAVEFNPVDRTVHHVRLMCLSFVQLAIGDHAFASRVTVCCAELVETVGKLALGGGPCSLRVKLSPSNQRVRVEVIGEGNETAIRALEEAVQATQGGTPLEAYTRSLIANGPGTEQMLSLARVRYEGQMAISSQRVGRRLGLVAESVG